MTVVSRIPLSKIIRTHERFRVVDPLYWRDLFWPDVVFAPYQENILYSLVYNVETIVVAGNELGKDFVAGFVIPWWFGSAMKMGHTCRIVATSVNEAHLGVVWGEAGRFLTTSRYPLIVSKECPNAPFNLASMALTRAGERMVAGKNPINYAWGMVAGGEKEALLGHHSETSLAMIDEASGMVDNTYEKMSKWYKRLFMWGNPFECENEFRRAVEAGDVLAA